MSTGRGEGGAGDSSNRVSRLVLWMSRRMWSRLTARCALCGEPLSLAEAMASRYACLTACAPLIRSRHLHTNHKAYLREVERAAPLFFYSFLALCVASLALHLSQQSVLALGSLASAIVVLTAGTLVRLRLLARHRRLSV